MENESLTIRKPATADKLRDSVRKRGRETLKNGFLG